MLLLLLATVRTTTTEVPRVVGEPLDSWVVLAVGAAVLVVILVAGVVARRRLSRAER